MNDRLRIASEQLAASLVARPMDGWQGSRITEAVRLADALIAAAGEQDDPALHEDCVSLAVHNVVVDHIQRERDAALARAADLKANLDEASRLARETAGEAMEVAGGKTCVWTRIGGDGPWHPACLGEHPHVSWSEWSRAQMIRCPHCGGEIVKGGE